MTVGSRPHAPQLLRIVLAPAVFLERARGRRRLVLIALYTFIALIACAVTWRATRLRGLPDIADPFDTARLRALSVAEDGNAFAVYRQASAKARRASHVEKRLFAAPFPWPAAGDREGLAYMADNAEALELWRQGSERPDALYVAPAAMTLETALPLVVEHLDFARMALVDASRLEAKGDMPGAWRDYRAVLRGSRLVGRHANTVGATVGFAAYATARAAIGAWAADPRVDVPLLRRALDEVIAVNAMTARPSETLRVEYLMAMRTTGDADWLEKLVANDPHGLNDVIDPKQWHNQVPLAWRARWFLTHEPERSRRLAKLVFANWLAHCDEPPERRPPPAGAFLFSGPNPPTSLTAGELAAKVRSTLLAKMVPSSGLITIAAFDRDRRTRAMLVVEMATRLFEKQFGRAPASVDELVGPCLDRLPEGYALPAEQETPAARLP